MESEDKAKMVTFKIVTKKKSNTADEQSIKVSLPRFGGGTAQEWLSWNRQFAHIAELKKWTSTSKDFHLRLVLDDEALEMWRDLTEGHDSSDDDLFEKTYRDWGLCFVPKNYSEQLEEELYMFAKRMNESVAECHQRLRKIVRMLNGLPVNSLTLDEPPIVRYFKRAMPKDWRRAYDISGLNLSTMAKAVQYFERLEQSERRQSKEGGKQNQNQNQKQGQQNANNSKKKGKGGNQGQKGQGQGNKKGKDNSKWCKLHKTHSHSDSECFTQQKNSKSESTPPAAASAAKKMEEAKIALTRIEEESWSDYNYSDEEEAKVIKTVSATSNPALPPMRLRMRLSGTRDKRVALLDTGCGKSYVNEKLMETNKAIGADVTKSDTNFEQCSGFVQASGRTTVKFRFMDLNYTTRIIHDFEVISGAKDEMVIGRDIMKALGMVVNFDEETVSWNGNTVKVNPGGKRGLVELRPEPAEPEELKDINDTSVKPTEMVGSADIDEEIYKQVIALLERFEKLYNGHLGKMKLPDYVLPIVDNYTPVNTRPYSIPKSMEEAARKEIQRLIELDVIEQIYDGEWASPAFFLQKPDGRLRLLTDFRGLNEFLKRHPYYLPLVREVITRLCGAKYFSTLDANMGYYARQIALMSRSLTAFCLFCGKYRYKRLPMGISTAPDEYQACMTKILGDLDFVIVYLDDILIFSKTAEEHLKHLEIVFKRLEEYNVTLNGKKCHIFCPKVNYLGFELSAEGIQPQEKKVHAIVKISPPSNKKQLRRFLGMVNFYREMIPGKSAMLKPLTKLTSPKAEFVWTPVEQEAFDGIKRLLAKAVLLSFPDFEKPFEIYTDASGKQIGGTIQQGEKLLACFSRSLTPAQQNYTTMELELLSVVEILKEYRPMLLGFEIVVRTDHKNLIYPTENSLRVKRWKLLLAEYRVTCEHIKGKDNIAADALSRLDHTESAEIADDEIEAMLSEPVECVLEGTYLRQHQQDDTMTQELIQSCLADTNDPDYKISKIMGTFLLTYRKRVVVPDSLRAELVEWYHDILLHPGPKRQYHTMKGTFYWSGMEHTVVEYVKQCMTCKRAKLRGGQQKYGKLPPRAMKVVDPFDVVHVDTMGPYGSDRQYALTVIDEATRWLEISVQENNRGQTTAENFDTTWLCRYPRPAEVIFDRGNEFNTKEFQEMLASYAIKPKPISAKNPQANAICERVHLVINNCIRCYPGKDWRQIVQYAAFSVRTSYNSILGTTPAHLIFGQDLMTRQLHDANWNYLSKRRFDAILRENDRENATRLEHFYHVGDHVMVRIAAKDRKTKHRDVAKGPYAIAAVHDNGTVTLDFGVTQERVNIRRLFPC